MTLEVTERMTLGDHVARLTTLGTTEHWVVSCYLKLEPRDRSRGKYLIKLKNRIRDQLEWLEQHELDRAIREKAARDCERIREYLEQPDHLPTGRGIAIFASEAAALFEVVPLPQVFRSRLVIDHSPLVRELAALDDEFGLVFCAVYDRANARFFRVRAGGAEELDGIEGIDVTRAGRYNYHRRIQEEKHRHHAEIADRLFGLHRGSGARGIVLGGTGTDAASVRAHLHPYLAKTLLGTVKLNPKSAGEADVLDAVLAVRRQSERAWELEHVQELQDGLATGWAVAGLEATLLALGRGQVRVLLVDPTVTRPGVRCGESGLLALTEKGCPDGVTAVVVADVVDEAIEEALRQGSHVDVIETPEAQESVDGLGALLRFVA